MNRRTECSIAASTRAPNSVGTVESTQMTSVFRTDSQNTGSLIRNPNCRSPTNFMSLRPSQCWKARNSEKTTGNSANTANIR